MEEGWDSTKGTAGIGEEGGEVLIGVAVDEGEAGVEESSRRATLPVSGVGGRGTSISNARPPLRHQRRIEAPREWVKQEKEDGSEARRKTRNPTRGCLIEFFFFLKDDNMRDLMRGRSVEGQPP